MNGKELMESMGYVDEQYIAEAEKAPVRRPHWQPLIATAACLALVLAGVWSSRSQRSAEDVPAAGVALYKGEAAAGGTARSVEETELAQTDAVPMMVSVPAEMTVRVVEQREDALVCLVIDPGTSDYQADDLVKIALPEAAEQGAAQPAALDAEAEPPLQGTPLAPAEQPAALDAEAEPPLYQVYFFPDQGSDTITPTQWNLLENTP